MLNDDFFKLNEDYKVEHLLSLSIEKQKELLDTIKKKNMMQFMKISGALKSRKNNHKSKQALLTIPAENIIVELDVNIIEDNPYQPRLEMDEDELLELAATIEEDGLIQPISVNKYGNNKYEVIAGHRRLAAHKLLNMKTIKSIVISELKKDDNTYSNKMAKVALVENLQRKDLDVLETAISIKNLLDTGVFRNQTEIAAALGKQKIYITQVLAILKVCHAILVDLQTNKSIKDVKALYYLQRVEDVKQQQQMYFDLIKREITREDIINYVKNQKLNADKKKEDVLPFSINISNKKVTLNTDVSKLTQSAKQKLEKELINVMKKYF